jgi:hypothetical protein
MEGMEGVMERQGDGNKRRSARSERRAKSVIVQRGRENCG